MADVKNNVTDNNGNNIDEKEKQGTPETPANNKEEAKEGLFKKVGNGIKKNGKKIAGVGLGLAALAVGTVIGDKFGLPPFGKKSDDGTEDPAEQ